MDRLAMSGQTASFTASIEHKLSPTCRGQQLAESRLAQIADDAAHCRRCPLYRNATQTVFGEGPVHAQFMMVGEQPGDQEDLEGHPFVGPVGRVLDRALEKAGRDRRSVYLTNAVEHFKHEQRGKRRLHKRPNRDEVEKCRWWLDRELALVKPRRCHRHWRASGTHTYGPHRRAYARARPSAALGRRPRRPSHRSSVGGFTHARRDFKAKHAFQSRPGSPKGLPYRR